MQPRSGKDRLIVALDVPTHAQAFDLVDKLDNVFLFKVGLELFMAGDVLGFIKKLQDRRDGDDGGVFVDLKLAGDIPETIAALVKSCMVLNVKFITFVEAAPTSITRNTLRAAREARGDAQYPRLLMVPLLSSLGADDLAEIGFDEDVDTFILKRGLQMRGWGCDGLIVSGQAIKVCRDAFGPDVDLVSPGIRPSWSVSIGSHKRHTTPAEAIRFGSDYLVVGKPITQDADPRRAAQRVIDEMDNTFAALRAERSSADQLSNAS